MDEIAVEFQGVSEDGRLIYQSSPEDFDHKKIQYFLDIRKNKAMYLSSDEMLESYALVATEHVHAYPTLAGLLLFGKNINLVASEAFIICSHFKGTSGRDAIASRDITGTLFEQYHDAVEFIKSRLNVSYKIQIDVKRN